MGLLKKKIYQTKKKKFKKIKMITQNKMKKK